MSNSIFGIGVSGLNAAQAGLLTTGHNISNVNTPGYSRQQIIQTTQTPQYTGSGYLGQGTSVSTVQRIYSSFLASQTFQQQAGASHLDTYNTQVSQLDNLLGDSTTGVAPALSDFFSGVNAVAANPADVPSRQSLISTAQSLANQFHQIDQQFQQSRTDVNGQITSSVTTINALATNIASLNQQIALSDASSGGLQPPNDLLDQRDTLITQLNQQIGATPVSQSDGSVNLFLPNGQPLVVGQQSYTLSTTPDPENPQDLQVGLQVGGSSVIQFRSSDLQGGTLGGLLAYRDNVLDTAENSLGRIAAVLSQSFNAQHTLGVDANGQAGTDFFNVPTPTVQNATTNTGTAAIAGTITDASALSTSDYNLRYDGTNYTLTKLSDNTTQTFATLPQTVDGVQIALTGGTPAAGDSFLIEPTRNAAANIAVLVTDPNKVAAAAPIRTTTASTNSGAATISTGSVAQTYLASPLASPINLTYNATTQTFSGFPATQAVTVTAGSTTTTYPAGSAVPYTTGATIAFGGISFTVSGSPANGDVFTVAPNTNGSGDNRNALALAALQSTNVVANTNLAGAYGQLVSFVGNAAQQAQVESTAQDTLLSQAQAAQQSVSGVNLDEEAANLQRYQQAYQAAAKVLTTATTLFDTILNIAATATT
jgi:flagellar hook-associated protein 1 FlgK